MGNFTQWLGNIAPASPTPRSCGLIFAHRAAVFGLPGSGMLFALYLIRVGGGEKELGAEGRTLWGRGGLSGEMDFRAKFELMQSV